jgi:DNA-binding IclR family transcriptional regulator
MPVSVKILRVNENQLGEVQPGIIESARPYLLDLCNAIGETVDLAEFRGNHLIRTARPAWRVRPSLRPAKASSIQRGGEIREIDKIQASGLAYDIAENAPGLSAI